MATELPFDPADVVLERYEDMTWEELIECCRAHDAHHVEHHEQEARYVRMEAALTRLRDCEISAGDRMNAVREIAGDALS